MSPPRPDSGAGKAGVGKDSAAKGGAIVRAKVRASRCPVCRRPRDETFKPFCSRHCADIDLARWLGGRYVIPGPETGEDESDSPSKPREEEE